MSCTYQSMDGFINAEFAVDNLAEFCLSINLRDLFLRCLDAGLIVWDDAYDEATNMYWLDLAGYRWVTDDADREMGAHGIRDERAFWNLVEELARQPRVTERTEEKCVGK